MTRPGFIDEETGEAFVIVKLSAHDRRRRTDAFVAMGVVGDCLAPRIQHDDVVIVDREKAWGPGAVIAFRGPNGRQLKEVVRHEAGELVLVSNEGEFTLRDDEVDITGVVVKGLRAVPGPWFDAAEARDGRGDHAD